MIINAEEIFEMAIQIERDGENFYKRAASIAPSPETKNFLNSLAGIEKDHQMVFIGIKDAYVAKHETTVPDLDGQALSYLRAMVEGKVFGSGPSTTSLNNNSSLNDIFQTAVDFEKNSVVFFSVMKKIVPDNDDKNKIDILINEEVGHIAVISREMAAVRKTSAL
jgi:rubrerythrin